MKSKVFLFVKSRARCELLPFDLESSNRTPFMKEDKSNNEDLSRRSLAREPTAKTTASRRFHLEVFIRYRWLVGGRIPVGVAVFFLFL